jgi:hypothetical protein
VSEREGRACCATPKMGLVIQSRRNEEGIWDFRADFGCDNAVQAGTDSRRHYKIRGVATGTIQDVVGLFAWRPLG